MCDFNDLEMCYQDCYSIFSYYYYFFLLYIKDEFFFSFSYT